MKKIFNHFKKILFQGIVFLGPILIAFVLADKIFEKSIHIINPIAAYLPFHSVLGVGKAYWAALLLLIAISFLMGIVAQLKFAQQFLAWLENNVLILLPGYLFMKQMRESIFLDDSEIVFKVVLFTGDDGKQLAYLVEEIDEQSVAIFVPGVPNPGEGDLFFVSKEKIKEIDLSYKESLKILRRHGAGAGVYLKGQI